MKNPIRFSQRVYPEKKCANPNCSFGGTFEPHDKRQAFCRPQCRINFHNDMRHKENKGVFEDVKRLKDINRNLALLYSKYVNKNGYCAVRKELLHFLEIDVMLLTRELVNKVTGRKVKKIFNYGIELHPDNHDYYIIHKI